MKPDTGHRAVNPATETVSLADQVRAVALEGLKYAKDPYDKTRYEKLLELAAAPFAQVLDLDFRRLMDSFKKEIGCVTPKLGTDAAVIDGQGRVLILKRSDDGTWCLPCGWVDVGEGPASAAIREVKEETGLDVRAKGYISISTKGPGKTQNIQHQVNTLVLMEPVSGAVTLSHEHTEWKWISSAEGINFHPGHDRQAAKIFAFLRSDGKILLPIE